MSKLSTEQIKEVLENYRNNPTWLYRSEMTAFLESELVKRSKAGRKATGRKTPAEYQQDYRDRQKQLTK